MKHRNVLGWVMVVVGMVSVMRDVEGGGAVCSRTAGKFTRAIFPDNFLWGTATAAFQVEGAIKKDCRGPGLWDVYCKRFPDRCSNHNADEAVDFYHRYTEDIQLLKQLNTNAFRLSIAWPRIFPHGRMEKGVSESGVKFYHDLIDALLQNGITPLVTVYHWDTPQDLEDEYGGFLSERIVKDFTEYAKFVFEEYGEKVKYWITFNEPWVFSNAGYDKGKKAPGRCSKYVNPKCHDGQSGHEAYRVSHNLLLAHAEAVQEFRKCDKCKGGKIGIAHSPAWFEPKDLKGTHAEDSIERILDFILGWHLHPTTFGDYPQSMKDRVGFRLPKFTQEQKDKLKNSADFVGMNYYTSTFAVHNAHPNESTPSWTQDSLVNWEPKDSVGSAIGSQPTNAPLAVYAKGMRKLLQYIKDKYGNPEIIIAENGYGETYANYKDVTVAEGINDPNRKTYLERHLLNLFESICTDKVNVTGYFVWSFIDNFEWQDGYNNRFGLYFVDFKNNLTRHQKLSGKWYSEFLKEDTKASKTTGAKGEL